MYLPSTTLGGNSDSDSESDADDENLLVPQFSCLGSSRKCYHLHTHAPAANVLYHLGMNALSGTHEKMELNSQSAKKWTAFQRREMKEVLKSIPVLKIRIPAK
ncbi:hypothetical protein EV359DRAFT_68616, partial [Lentinula novae-zelandiae]